MPDEAVNDSANVAADSAPTGDRPRKSRKRGRRNRPRSAEETISSPSTESETAVVEAARPQPQPPRERTPRRSGHRGGSHGYADRLDRYICTQGRQTYPEMWPVNHRRGTAVATLHEVDRRGDDRLLCDRLHAGYCLWPDGVIAVATVDLDGPSDVSTETVSDFNPPAEPILPLSDDA